MPYITWNGSPTFSGVDAGSGKATFTLNGSATFYDPDMGASTEASYQILCNGVHIAYLNPKTKTVDVYPGPTRTYTCRAYVTWYGVTYYSTSGDPSCTLTVAEPIFAYTAGSVLNATETGSGYYLELDGDGYISNGYSDATIYYMFLRDGSMISGWWSQDKYFTDSNPPQGTSITYTIQAYIVLYDAVTQQYMAISDPVGVSVVVGGNYVNYYDGTDWVQCKVFYYDGTDWIECKPYYYNGSGWVEISS